MTLGEIFTALGFAVGGLVFYLAARARRLATQGISMLVMVGLLGGVVGAKLSQLVVSGWPVSVPVEVALDPKAGGRALFGGLVFGWICVEIAKRSMGIKRSTGDLFAVALPAGEAVGRIGCYLNGCCWGQECNLPWAVHQHGAWRHPAQLYSSATVFLLFLFLLWLRSRLTKEGDLWKAYLLGFGLTRFCLEFFRFSDGGWLGLSLMQWFCVELTASVMIVWWWKSRKQRRMEAV